MSGNVIRMRTNFPAIARRLEELPEQIANRAMVRSMNAVIDQGKIQMSRQISREFKVSVGQAKERLEVSRAYAKGGVLRFEASLSATKKQRGRSMNLIAFVEKVVSLSQARKRMKAGEGGAHTLRNGATVRKSLELRFQIKRGGGAKVIPGAFIGNKGRTVFIRQGKSRMPIAAVNTIDIPQMFNAKRINSVVRKVMLERFGPAFERELRVVLKGFAK